MKDVMSLERGVSRAPPDETWPEADLEYLGKCPVCGEPDRSLAYSGLRDKVFFCAPGVWTSWRCGGCHVVYLDPRPTPESIGRAYENYYTHHDAGSLVAPSGGLGRRLRRIVANSYLNKKFGYMLRPALPLAWLPIAMKPKRALYTAHYYRHLPAPSDKDDYLLDVGCGNGMFLQIARDYLGYQVEGLEIDPNARDVATRRGLKVHSGLMPGSGLTPARYYQITLSHVLEHMHDPVAALQEVFSLLKPGGRVWISVPNIAAASLSRFGSNSRLLEPPRHLVMFDPNSLEQILEKVGFTDVTLLPHQDSHPFVHYQSWMMENGFDPYSSSDVIVPEKERRAAIVGSKSALSDPKSVNIFAMTAKRQK
jgi:SAM-dependent methyltransferase